MLKPEAVLSILNTKLGIETPAVEIRPLMGDASNRSYYRLHFQKEGRAGTFIVMELAGPESFKKSEEAVSGPSIPIDELPYINILNHLDQSDVAVPRLHYFDPAAGLLILDDLGDRTLETEMKVYDEGGTRRFYRLAIDELLKIQRPATRATGGDCIAFGRGFGVALYMWEFDHFLEYGIEARSGIQIRAGDRERIRGEFLKISERLSAEPKVLTHRDFHSRNLMVFDKRIWVLDFQDALMGPCVYDLASLLRDSYVILPEAVVDELIEYYLQNAGPVPTGSVKEKGPAFRRLFDLMSIQRNLKAAGRFVYIDVVKKKDNLLSFIPQTLASVRRNLDRYDELKKLKEALRPYVEELRDAG